MESFLRCQQLPTHLDSLIPLLQSSCRHELGTGCANMIFSEETEGIKKMLLQNSPVCSFYLNLFTSIAGRAQVHINHAQRYLFKWAGVYINQMNLTLRCKCTPICDRVPDMKSLSDRLKEKKKSVSLLQSLGVNPTVRMAPRRQWGLRVCVISGLIKTRICEMERNLLPGSGSESEPSSVFNRHST